MDTTRISYKIDSIVTANNKVHTYTTIETTENNLKFFDSHFFEALIWPLTFLIILLIFKEQIKLLFGSLIKRLNDGDEISFPGGIVIKQGTTKLKLDETVNTQTFETDLSYLLKDEMTKKILSTFWKQQTKLDNTYKNRWTFIMSGEDYRTAITKLILTGLVAFDSIGHQYFLTDYGISFCGKNISTIGSFSFFD
jgi:hypothetical protein